MSEKTAVLARELFMHRMLGMDLTIEAALNCWRDLSTTEKLVYYSVAEKLGGAIVDEWFDVHGDKLRTAYGFAALDALGKIIDGAYFEIVEGMSEDYIHGVNEIIARLVAVRESLAQEVSSHAD